MFQLTIFMFVLLFINNHEVSRMENQDGTPNVCVSNVDNSASCR